MKRNEKKGDGKMNRRSSDGTRGGCGGMVTRTGRRGTGERNGKEDGARSVDGLTREGGRRGRGRDLRRDERLEAAGMLEG